MKEARYRRPYIVRFHLYKMSRIGKSIETERRLVVSRGWWEGREENEVSFWGDKNVLELGSGDGCTALWIY